MSVKLWWYSYLKTHYYLEWILCCCLFLRERHPFSSWLLFSLFLCAIIFSFSFSFVLLPEVKKKKWKLLKTWRLRYTNGFLLYFSLFRSLCHLLAWKTSKFPFRKLFSYFVSTSKSHKIIINQEKENKIKTIIHRTKATEQPNKCMCGSVFVWLKFYSISSVSFLCPLIVDIFDFCFSKKKMYILF